VKPCIFDEDDDDKDNSDDDDNKTNKSKSAQAPVYVNTNSSRIKKQTQIDIEKALVEDPNIFEYDEIYDKLEDEKQKIDPKLKNKTENELKEPKYIAGLLKASAKRRMEFEKLQERKIQKEREAEGDLWKDKETFVTTSYRLKMEELQRLEEEERKQDNLEALFDVRKQSDLSGFYNSMLKIKTGEMVIEEEGDKERRLQKEKQIEEISKQQKVNHYY
jgi:coiled-coil domain-containing protein 55